MTPPPPSFDLDFAFWKDTVLALTALVGAGLGLYNFFAAQRPVKPTLQARVTPRLSNSKDAEYQIKILAFNDSTTTNIVWTSIRLPNFWRTGLASTKAAYQSSADGKSLVERGEIDRSLFGSRTLKRHVRINYSSPGDRSSGSFDFLVAVPTKRQRLSVDCTFASTSTGGYKGTRRIGVDLRLHAPD